MGTPIWAKDNILFCVDLAESTEVMIALSSPNKDGWILVSSPRGIQGWVYKKYVKRLRASGKKESEA